MKQISTLAFLISSISQLGWAGVADLTQTFSHTSTSATDSFTLPSFDTRLGELTGVSVKLSGSYTLSLSANVPAGASATASISGNSTLTFPHGPTASIYSSESLNLTPANTVFSTTVAPNFTTTIPSPFTGYSSNGAGSVNFSLVMNANISASGSFGVTFTPGASNIAVVTTVTYSYTPSNNPLLPQTISFSQPPTTSITAGSQMLSASSDSGLPVSFASKTTSTCTMSGSSAVQLVAAGVCTIEATQAGNAIYSPATPVDRSFTIIPANLISVDYPGADGTVLTGINHYGQVSGIYRSGQNQHSFIYQIGAGTFNPIPDFAEDTVAHGINDNGIIVGDGLVSGSTVAGHFLYNENAKTFTSITALGPGPIIALGIDNQNDVVGFSGSRGFFLSQGTTFSAVDFPNASSTSLQGVTSAAGVGPRSVGFYADSNDVRHGLLSVVGGVLSFDYPGASQTQGMGIYAQASNSSIQIVGLYTDSGGHEHGFQYSGLAIFTTIDFPGATDTNVLGINDAGVVVGSYLDSGSGQHGFVRTKP